MRFNLHCHVFNLQSVFSQETRNIIDQRIRDAGFASSVTQIVLAVLDGLMGHPEAIEKLQKLIDPRQQNDFLEFLKVALLPDMDEVTNWLVGQLPGDVVITPLMMDPTTLEARDDWFFRRQLDNTARQMFRYPGRVLPFVAVNPLRPSHKTFMEMALWQGFVGVKLYPSLGYEIDSEEIELVVRHCAKNEVPILQHCSRGGFYADKTFIDNSRPKAWKTYLEDVDGLKICFGHFGGEQDFIGRNPPDDSNWNNDVIELMHAHPGKVYADIAYHTTGMPPHASDPYWARLKDILADPGLRPFVLWGTDSLMVRMACTEREYWHFFQGLMADADFRDLSEKNALEFLGFTDTGEAKGKNLLGYVAYMSANKGRIAQLRRQETAPWLAKYLR